MVSRSPFKRLLPQAWSILTYFKNMKWMTERLFRTIEKGHFLRTEPPEAEQFRVFIFQVNNTLNYIQDLVSNFILFFLMWTIFKSFEFVTPLLLFHVFIFWSQGTEPTPPAFEGEFLTTWTARSPQDWASLFFNCRITALQYCVGFCHTTVWIRHKYTYDPSLSLLSLAGHSPFLSLSHCTGLNSLNVKGWISWM